MRSVVEFADADDGAGGRENAARIVADAGTPVGQVAHFAGIAGGRPFVIAGAVGGGFGGGDTGQFEAAFTGKFLNLRARQISSPTERISSMALLLRTTPGRIL